VEIRRGTIAVILALVAATLSSSTSDLASGESIVSLTQASTHAVVTLTNGSPG
jgi:hypothetical protein